jgi:hypothetical protein
MQFIQGYNRNQTTFSTLDDQVEAGKLVRLMKVSVDKSIVGAVHPMNLSC